MSTHPPIQQADLDPPTLFRLFRDIGSVTTLMEIIYKAAPNTYAPEPITETNGAEQLKKAQALLLSGKVSGVQLRYLYQDVEWWVTLGKTRAGVRLMRMRHPRVDAA